MVKMSDSLQVCPRCEVSDNLDIDPQSGFLCCECGWFDEQRAEQDRLVHNRTVGDDGQETGAYISQHDDGRQALVAFRGAETSRGVGRLRSEDSQYVKYQRDAQNILRAAANALKFKATRADEAWVLFKRIHDSKDLHLGGGSYATSQAGLAGSVLLVIARASKMAITLAEMAAAVSLTKAQLAYWYRLVCDHQDCKDSLSLQEHHNLAKPSQHLESLTLRYVKRLLLEQSTPLRHEYVQILAATDADQQPQALPAPATGPSTSRGNAITSAGQRNNPAAAAGNAMVVAGNAGGAIVTAEQAELDERLTTLAIEGAFEGMLKRIPFVKEVSELANLVAKTGIHEGRPSTQIAGAIMLYIAEGYPNMQCSTVQVSKIVGVSRESLNSTKNYIQQNLLKLAMLLPLNNLLNASNVRQYLPLIISATHTIVALKRKSNPSDKRPEDIAQLEALLRAEGPARKRQKRQQSQTSGKQRQQSSKKERTEDDE